MNTFTVRTDCGTDRSFESRREAERGAETHVELCEDCDADDVEVVAATGDGDVAPPATGESAGRDLSASVATDPLDVVPDYMIETVDGHPTINKRGYAVIANRFDIVVEAEAITPAGDTDHEYAEFRAQAWRREDGPEAAYTGHGTARASEDTTNIENNLNEMAETRAMKRAVAWASGVGILAWDEMTEHVDDASAPAR